MATKRTQPPAEPAADEAKQEPEGPLSLEDARARLAALQEEQRGLPAAIEAAQRAVNVEEWMKLRNRELDLPGEIEAARVAVLPFELDEAWTAAEARYAEEQRARAAVAESQAESERLNDESRGKFGPDATEHLAKVQRHNLKHQQLVADRMAAEAATMRALMRVDELEAAMRAAGLEPPGGSGFRAPIRPLTRPCGPLTHMNRELEHEIKRFGRLEAGNVPPRWVAHRLREWHFEDPELEKQRRRAAEEADAERRRKEHEDWLARVEKAQAEGRSLIVTGRGWARPGRVRQ